MKKILFLLMIGFAAMACDRDIEFKTISVTEPSLDVQVELPKAGNEFPKVESATVELYRNDLLVKTSSTNAKGRVHFSKSDLGEKGSFKVVAYKQIDQTPGATRHSGEKTDYLLLNDGGTLWIVTLVQENP